MRFRRPSPATLIALLALFVALDGPAAAAKMLRANSVTSKQVRNRSLSERDLSTAAVRALQRTPIRGVGRDQLRGGAVTGDKLADSSVGSRAVADQTLTGADLAPQSLGAGALSARSVGFAEMADDAVGKANLRTASAGKSEIAESAIGTEEVIDGKLRMGDLGSFAGVPQLDLGTVSGGDCGSADVDVAAIENAQQADLTRTFILVGQPSTFPDDVAVSGRAVDADTLRVTACNLGSGSATLSQALIPFVALVP